MRWWIAMNNLPEFLVRSKLDAPAGQRKFFSVNSVQEALNKLAREGTPPCWMEIAYWDEGRWIWNDL